MRSAVEDSTHPGVAGCGDDQTASNSVGPEFPGRNSIRSMATTLGPVNAESSVNSVEVDCDPALAGLQPIKNKGEVQPDPVLTGSGLAKSDNADPVLSGSGLVKSDNADPVLSGSGLAKSDNADPVLSGSGLAKSGNADPVLSGSGLVKSENAGPVLSGSGFGQLQEGGVSSMSLREISVRVNPDDENLLIPICINGVDTEAVVDTGAQCTVISEALLPLMKQELSFEETVILREAQANSQMVAKRAVRVPLSIGSQAYIWDIYVAPLTDKCILGIDFLRSHGGEISLKRNTLTLDESQVRGRVRLSDLSMSNKAPVVRRVTLARKVVVPPNSVVRAKVSLHSLPGRTYMIDAPAYNHKGILIPFSVTTTPDGVSDTSKRTSVVLNFLNDSEKFIHLRKGHVIGNAEEVEILPEVESSIRSKLGSCETSVDDSEIRLQLGSEESTNESTNIRSKLGDVSQPVPIVRKVDPLLPSGGEMPTHLRDLWSRSSTKRIQDQSTRLAEVLIKYADQFSVDDLDLGCFSEVTHKVDTGSAKPIRQKMRRTPLGFENEEKQHLDGLLDIGVIQPSNSEWASPPVLIRKKDGKVRWCIDYRALNNVTTKDAFPLPNISECLDILGNTMYFSTLDMSSGYYQIAIDEEDRAKTAFLTKYGLYEHCRMPFGLCNAPATFQRAMTLILKGLTWKEVLAYLDDIMILGCSFDDHLENIIQVLERFRKYNLPLFAAPNVVSTSLESVQCIWQIRVSDLP